MSDDIVQNDTFRNSIRSRFSNNFPKQSIVSSFVEKSNKKFNHKNPNATFNDINEIKNCTCHPIMTDFHVNVLDPNMHSWNCQYSRSQYAQKTCLIPSRRQSVNPVFKSYKDLVLMNRTDIELLSKSLNFFLYSNQLCLPNQTAVSRFNQTLNRMRTSTVSSRAKQINKLQNTYMEKKKYADASNEEIIKSLKNLEKHIYDLSLDIKEIPVLIHKRQNLRAISHTNSDYVNISVAVPKQHKEITEEILKSHNKDIGENELIFEKTPEINERKNNNKPSESSIKSLGPSANKKSEENILLQKSSKVHNSSQLKEASESDSSKSSEKNNGGQEFSKFQESSDSDDRINKNVRSTVIDDSMKKIEEFEPKKESNDRIINKEEPCNTSTLEEGVKMLLISKPIENTTDSSSDQLKSINFENNNQSQILNAVLSLKAHEKNEKNQYLLNLCAEKDSEINDLKNKVFQLAMEQKLLLETKDALNNQQIKHLELELEMTRKNCENQINVSNKTLNDTISKNDILFSQLRESQQTEKDLQIELANTKIILDNTNKMLSDYSPESRKQFLDCIAKSTIHTNEQINQLFEQINILHLKKTEAENTRNLIAMKLEDAKNQIYNLESALKKVEDDYAHFYNVLQQERLTHLQREKIYKETELRNNFLNKCLAEYESTIKLKNDKISEITQNRFQFKNAFELMTEKHVLLKRKNEALQESIKEMLRLQQTLKKEKNDIQINLEEEKKKNEIIKNDNKNLKHRLDLADVILIRRSAELKELSNRFEQKSKQIDSLLKTIQQLKEISNLDKNTLFENMSENTS